jgi:hypothetical protein
MKFGLLKFPEGCFTCVAEVYVCAAPHGGYNEPDPRAGHDLLTHESTSAEECHAQIDQLIAELSGLKAEVSRFFKKQDGATERLRLGLGSAPSGPKDSVFC